MSACSPSPLLRRDYPAIIIVHVSANTAIAATRSFMAAYSLEVLSYGPACLVSSIQTDDRNFRHDRPPMMDCRIPTLAHT